MSSLYIGCTDILITHSCVGSCRIDPCKIQRLNATRVNSVPSETLTRYRNLALNIERGEVRPYILVAGHFMKGLGTGTGATKVNASDLE